MDIGKFLDPRVTIGQLRARRSRVKLALEVLPVGLLVSWRAADHGLPWNLGLFASTTVSTARDFPRGLDRSSGH
jgi:hypothetical protein